MVDSLQVFEILKAGSISETQARAMTQAIQKAEIDIGSDIRSVIRQEFVSFEAKMDVKFAAVDQRIEASKVETLRWNFAFWVAQLAAIAGILKLLK